MMQGERNSCTCRQGNGIPTLQEHRAHGHQDSKHSADTDLPGKTGRFRVDQIVWALDESEDEHCGELHLVGACRV